MLTKCKAMDMQQRTAMAKAVMDEVCNEYMQNPDAAIVDLQGKGKTMLIECGLANYEQVHSKQTLTHPWNRGHDLLEPADVPEKMAEISDIGWDTNKVADASGVRMPKDDTLRKQIEAINDKLAHESDGVLPPMIPGFATLQVTACSHTTAGLKCANFGTKCDIDRISDNGVMSKERIIGRQPSMADPIEKGLRYLVMDSIVQELWPSFVEMTIEAANASNQLAKPDTPLQHMLKVHKYVLDAAKRNEKIDDKVILRKMLRTKPSHPEDMKALIAYAINWSGGDDPIFLRRFQKYTKTLRNVHRLKGPIMQNLAEAELGAGAGSRWRCAVMMAIATHDNITLTHVKSMKGKKDSIFAAEKIMIAFDAALEELRSQMDGVSIDQDTMMTIASADLDQKCVFFVHSIVKGQFTSLRDIAAKIFRDLAVSMSMSGVQNPFVILRTDDGKGPALKKAKVTETDGATTLRLKQLTESSTLSNKAATLRGMIDTTFVKYGGSVRLKASMATEYGYTIVSLNDATMTAILTKLHDVTKHPYTVSYQSLVDDYKLFIDPTVTASSRHPMHRLLQQLSATCIAMHVAFQSWL